MEQYWISQFKTWGFSLTNQTLGGDGVSKGNIPWNKNTCGVCKANLGTWAKGHKSKTSFKAGNEIGRETRWKKGQLPPNSTKVAQFSLIGEFIKEYECFKFAGEAVGVTGGAISNCIQRKTYKSKGYIWKLVN